MENTKKYKNFSIDVLGQTWQVLYYSPIIVGAERVCGYTELATLSIWIDPKQSEKLVVITLLHELFHAYVRRSGIYNGNLSEEMEEIISDQFATVLAENFDFKL